VKGKESAVKGKESAGTPTKVAHPSPSRQPTRSPLTASKFNASNSKPNVSYGELQIVLENIQEIRRKANQQIAILTGDNQKLREELTRSHQDFEELSNRLNHSNSKNDF
jgi:molecular chaperone GrpE (heat shock protein)